jgi:hypothetical protein
VLIGVDRDQQRLGGGHQHCAERSLDRAGADQHHAIDRSPTDRGRGCETDDANHQRLPRPESVREAAAGQKQRGERQRVGAQDPLAGAGRDAQRVLGRGQCDAHHRDVEDRHQMGGRDHPERPPAWR